MVQITFSQKIAGLLAYGGSIFILLMILVWFGKYEGGFAWSSDLSVGDPYKVFNLHPVMMVLGYLIFPTQAMLVYRMLPIAHGSAKVFHFMMHIFSMICVAIGITAAIAYHYRSSTAHFQSLHSWFGLGTMSLFGLQFILGFFAYAWPKLPFEARKSSIPFHQFLGMVIFFMACATACLGIGQKIVNIQLRAAADGKPIPPVGPEVQLAHWAAIGIAILFALVLYVVMAGVGKRPKERASAEEIESLRQKASYEHDY